MKNSANELIGNPQLMNRVRSLLADRPLCLPFGTDLSVAQKLLPDFAWGYGQRKWGAICCDQSNRSILEIADWRSIKLDPATMVLVHHPLDVGPEFISDLSGRLKKHTGPIVVLLDRTMVLHDSGQPRLFLTPPYAAIDFEIIKFRGEIAGPAIALREAIDG